MEPMSKSIRHERCVHLIPALAIICALQEMCGIQRVPQGTIHTISEQIVWQD